MADQGRFLRANAPRRSWLRAALTPAELTAAAWSPTGWSRQERWLYTVATRVLWDYAHIHGSRAILELEEPLLGSPLPVAWRGRLISQDLANVSLETAALMEALRARQPQRVVEIGAGYGRTAYGLLSLWPDVEYTIVDIEPALTISGWYLGTLFPERRVEFVHASDTDKVTGQFDAAISISSLQEMTKAEVDRYLHFIDAHAAPGAVVYLKQWEGWVNMADGITHTMDDYPVPARWRLLFRRPAAVQTMFHEAAWEVMSA